MTALYAAPYLGRPGHCQYMATDKLILKCLEAGFEQLENGESIVSVR
jgi:hypothetical protein